MRTTPLGPAARWLLLLLTAFGLTMMHTLGHAGMQMGTPAAPHAATLGVHAPAAVSAPLTCPDDHCPHHSGMDGWSICLAILGGLAVIVVLAAHLATRRHLAHIVSAANRAARGSRSPPRSPTGLLIASTAALRI